MIRNAVVFLLKSFVLLAVALIVALGSEAVAAPREPIVITLHPVTRLTSAIVRISDVADITGGDERLRARIGMLDLEDSPDEGIGLQITPQQVEFRLRLARIDPQSVVIRGRSQTGELGGINPPVMANQGVDATSLAGNTCAKNAAERCVIDAAKACLANQLPWPEDDVAISLAQPLPRALSERIESTPTICSAELTRSGTPVGRVSMRVILKSAGERSLTVPLQFDVRHMDNVAVTSKPIAAGHSLKASDFVIARRDVTQLTGYCSSPEPLVGQTAKRVLPAALVVRASDVEAETRVTGPPVVKRRDRLKAIARSGVLQVTVVGEAMQDGRVGEVIKVKNVDSSSVLYGRVLNAKEVEVTE